MSTNSLKTNPKKTETNAKEAPAKNWIKKHAILISSVSTVVVVAIVFAILWFTGVFKPKPQVPVNPPMVYDTKWENLDTSAYSTYYTKNNQLMARKADGTIYCVSDQIYAGEVLAEYPSGMVAESLNGSSVYYIKGLKYNDTLGTYFGDLCVRYNDGEEILIDSDVPAIDLQVSKDGTAALYNKIVTQQGEDGSLLPKSISLYRYTKDKGVTQITASLGYFNMPAFSHSDKYIAYTEASPLSGDMTTANPEKLFITANSEKIKPILVSDNVVAFYGITDNGTAYYSKAEGTENTRLYYKPLNKPAVKLPEKAGMDQNLYSRLNSNFAYYIITSSDEMTGAATGDFYAAAPGKQAQKINSGDYPISYDVANQKYLFTKMQSDSSKLTLTLSDYGKTVVIAKDVSAYDYYSIKASRDYTKFIYLKDYNPELMSGTLCLATYKDGTVTEKKIAYNVNSVFATKNFEYIAFTKNLDLYTGIGDLYLHNGKEAKKIATKVPSYSVLFTNNNKNLLFMSDFAVSETDSTGAASLMRIELKDKLTPVQIDSGVSLLNQNQFCFAARTNGKVFYLKNYDATAGIGDLYVAEPGKTPELVDNGISELTFE